MTICKYVREGANSRLAEARELLVNIKNEEPQEGVPRPPTPLSSALRGLMYVSLYGAIEYAVTHGVQCFINHMCGLKVSTKHLESSLYSIALNSQLESARGGAERRKWEARRAIFVGVDSEIVCSIPDTVFGGFLHNVYPKTVLEIFLCLGISKPATISESEIGYLNEITEKRNAVAHGRETATEAGKGLSVKDLELRLSVLYSACSYFLDVIEEHALELRFVKLQYRAGYQEKAAG
ncbi:HEPN domain-containing protein [Pseudomonas sp. TWR2-1-1]|uniref:HEPN domain-containing protein n=1 Tax=Pseudomonas sp. TWR2-1-1 TaxID=2804610 RepID=UPI003CF83E5D